MKFTRYIPRILFHVSEIEKNFKRSHHLNQDSENFDWVLTIADSYFFGYNESLKAGKDFEKLCERLDSISPELRGFAYEGAGTGLALLKIVSPFHKNDLHEFTKKYGDHHYKTVGAGIGLAIARLGVNPNKYRDQFDKEQFEFIIDGYAFFEGCFSKKEVSTIKPHKDLSQEYIEIFYRGLGRSLWFRTNGNLNSVEDIISTCKKEYRHLLWRGCAIACAYAGKISTSEIKDFVIPRPKISNELFAGFKIAQKARQEGKIVTEYTSSLFKLGESISVTRGA